ncbi:TPA: hypothetical protein MYN30_001099 [Klebsiella variicola subsp. variicola]|nr:hypothetical protein [Klebsiella variicola subsp. variicola]
MTLLEILIQELPKRGGWDAKWHQCAQDGNGEVCFFTSGKIHFRGFFDTWSIPPDSVATHDGKARIEALLADDYAETIITREQYESALAAKNDGWIEWGGGKCPLHHGAIVDVKLRNGRTEYAQKALSLEGYASYPFWRNDGAGGDIIAYRLHKPQQEGQSEASEEDHNDCIGQAPDTAWNGEGLPPVGCDCQYRKHKKSEQSEWLNGVVKYASEFTVVIQPVCYAGETIGHPDNFEFRTIPSEDDIKRDASIKAIFDVLAQYDSLKGCHTYEGKADYIYSAIASGVIPHISIDHNAE